jgi:CRP-like cAMP-binding protein
MGFPKIAFQIVKANKCPLFEYGEVFSLTGIAISMQNTLDNSCVITAVVHGPPNRENCKILSADLTKIIIEHERADKVPACIINCSGCTGSIRLEHNPLVFYEKEDAPPDNEELESIMHILSRFSFFRNIDSNSLKDVLRFFKLKQFNKDAIIIRKGDPGGNFFIIVSGKVEILNDVGITISSLEKGEVFGEMSLICDEEVGATVQASEKSEILYINQKFFKKILRKYPSFQLYFTKLMAKRLTASNKIRSEDYASGMIGKLEEIPPEALFQTLNINQKTGILTITQLTSGTARFSLRHGALIKASYKGKSGEDAFYDVLKEKEGRFKFTPGLPPEDFEIAEIGYFMKLLMEGLRRIDEQKSNKTN